MKLKTPQQVKIEFIKRGEDFSAWAEQHGFRRDEVYAVLNGRSKARRGKGHQIAVLLGLKASEPEAA